MTSGLLTMVKSNDDKKGRDFFERHLGVLKWTAAKSWVASPCAVVVRAILAVIRGAFVCFCCYAGWKLIDRLLLAFLEPADAPAQLLRIAVSIAILFLLSLILDQTEGYFARLAGFKLNLLLTGEFITKSSEIDLADIESAGDRDLLNKRQGLNHTASGVMNSLYSVLFLSIQAAGIVWLCFFIGRIAFLTLVMLLVIGVVWMISRPRSGNHREKEWRETHGRFFYLQHLLVDERPSKEIRLFGLFPFLKPMAMELAEKIERSQLPTKRGILRDVLLSLAYCGILIWFSYRIFLSATADQMSIGLAVMAVGVVVLSERVFMRFGYLFHAWSHSEEGIQAYEEFMGTKTTIAADPSLPGVPDDLGGGVQFDHVSLTYPTRDAPSLSDISLTIRPGERIALVGENGSGKTTLIKLLTRLYDPTEGKILIEGRDLREYNVESYRKRFGVIFQDFVHYHGTVTENIGYAQHERMGNPEAIRDAAGKAGAREFIDDLDQDFETSIGSWFEKGTALSGGQWQKIALARAFFREADILVLDEPTSVLDARAEYDIFKRFLELTEGKTTVLISHRFSTVRMADTIYVFKEGKIEESGSHAELMMNDGPYAELFNMQAEGYLAAGADG